MPAGVRRAPDAPPLSDAELQELASARSQLPDLETVGDSGMVELTDAELAILEEKGASVRVSDSKGEFDEEDPSAIENGRVLFKIGQGRSQFTGRLTHREANDQFVTLWTRERGEPRKIPRSHVLYYVGKGFSPRPPEDPPVPPPTLKCPSRWKVCSKLLRTSKDVSGHMQKAHGHEWKAMDDERKKAREEKLDSILDSIGKGGGNQNDALLAAIYALTESVQAATGVDPADLSAEHAAQAAAQQQNPAPEAEAEPGGEE